MKKIETFVPEEGDKLILIQSFTDLGLSKGDIVLYVNSISMGVICKKINTGEQCIVPYNALKGIHCGNIVDLTFQ